jgi:trehalose-phosphatase
MLPCALDHLREIAAEGNRLAIFLDYDGTLTPIVSHPEQAVLSTSMRQTLRKLATAPVAILSGRDLDDVRQRVGISEIVYAGCHGFDIAGPGGLRKQVAAEFLPDLDAAEKELRETLDKIAGARVERKRFSLGAHYRHVDAQNVAALQRAVRAVAARHRALRTSEGKKVYELQPDVDWDKGKALVWILESLKATNRFPIYIGDDLTDEDAFRAVAELRGAGILVSEQPRPTAAGYLLRNPGEVEHFLRALAERLESRPLGAFFRPRKRGSPSLEQTARSRARTRSK